MFGVIGFKTKEFLCHGQLQQSMLSPAAGVFGTDCDVTDGSRPTIFLEKKAFTHKN